jgi:DNA-binding SARP family transcriptional activator
MEFRILGPLEAIGPDGPVLVRGAKRRGLLAYLLVHAGEAVSLDRLVDDLWDQRPSSGARGTVQSYLSGLRKVLADSGGVTLETQPSGYVLNLPEDCFDAARFARLCAEAASEPDAAERLDRVDQALGLWRGAPLAEFAGSAWADVEATRLEALRLHAVQQRVDARLALGRHAEVIPELEGLVADHQLDERLWAQLVVAYYRAGRQADALRGYQRVRTILADELGIEPGGELANLERQILDHDPVLDLAPPADQAVSPTESLPEGVLTFLLTDIADSTRLWDVHPRAMARAIARHEELVGAAVQAHGGRLVKSRGEGDSTLSVFSRASDAAAAAMALKEALAAEAWPEDLSVQTRIALHTGEAQLRGGDYYGGALNRAARIRALGAGGDVLCSRATADLVADMLPAEVVLQEAGTHDLKGLRRAETIYALVDRIDSNGPRVPRTGAARTPPAGVSGLPPRDRQEPFVGRDPELEQLRAWWRDPADPVRLTLIAGEAGIGKTTLATTFAHEVRESGSTVLYGRAVESADSSYEPVIGALREFVITADDDEIAGLGETGAAALCRLVPEMAERRPEAASHATQWTEVDRSLVLQSIAASFADPDQQSPVLVVLDDLQWANPPGLSLLARLVGPGSRLRVLATYRDQRGTAAGHLGDFLAQLRRDDQPVRRISLSGLSRDDVVDFVAALAGGDLSAAGRALADDLHRRTTGNSLFLRESLRHLEDIGAISPADDRWASDRPLDALGIPAGIQDVVAQRLSHLQPATREVLQAGAVIGLEFEVDIAASVLSADDTHVVDALDDALAAGLVEEDVRSVDRYRFVHALVHEVVLSELTTSRRTRLAWRAGEALEHLRSEDHAGEIARQLVAGAAVGDPGRAVDWSRRAGADAMRRLAYEEAIRHYEDALQCMSQVGEVTEEDRVDVLLALGRASVAASDAERRRSACLEAASIARRSADPERLALAAITFLGQLAPGAVDVEVSGMLEEAAVALRGATASPPRRALLAEVLARLSGYLSNIDADRSAVLAEEALQTARCAGDERVLALALMHTTQAYALEREEHLSRLHEAERLAESVDDQEVRLAAHSGLMAAALIWADRDEFDRHLAEYARIANSLRSPRHMLLSDDDHGGAAALDGRYAEAREQIRSVFRRARRLGDPNLLENTAVGLFLANRELGRLNVESVRQVAEAAPHRPVFRASLVLTLCDVGETDEAAALLEALLDDPMLRSGLLRRFSLSMLAESAALLGDTRSAAQLYEWLAEELRHGDGVIIGPNAFFGAVRRYLGLLASTLGRAGDAVAHHEAALDVHERMRARGWAARSRYDLARALLARDEPGDAARAAELLAAAIDAAEELGMPKLLDEARAVPLGGAQARD